MRLMPTRFRPLTAVVLIFSIGLALISCQKKTHWDGSQKLIILGIDGMDPQLLRQFMQQGRMPHFSALAQRGSFRELGTSIPPQSPVAWSNLITGMDAGGHAIFDFIHRDPDTLQPYLSTSRIAPAKYNLRIGPWVIPIGGGSAQQLRRGKSFWEYLDDYGIPSTVYRIPANFPPVPSKAHSLSGMGTPDLRGGYGIFSFYTDDPMVTEGSVEGGEIIPVEVKTERVTGTLRGPENSFRRGAPLATVPFLVEMDPVEPAARISIQSQQFVLQEGEWSDWIKLNFSLVPGVASVKGICRFYLKQTHPRFQMYVSPINIDPADPALPLSTPANYSKQLTKEAGEFYTQGIAEDTKALSAGVLDDKEFLEESREVFSEHRRVFNAEFPKYFSGLFFYYFSSIDLNSHMFWRYIDPKHPEYSVAGANEFGQVLSDFYQQMDEVLGQVMARLDDHTTLLVLSDHGFAPYYRSFNLNTWLLNNGYITISKNDDQKQDVYFAGVDWGKTQAYGLGLNGLYLNLAGRERNGVVSTKQQDGLLAKISQELLALRDPATGAAVITRVDRARAVYHGPYAASGPDLVIGYNRGYRAGWKTILGAFPHDVLEDNTNPWSGDHCMDPDLVPGVLLSNKTIVAASPALTDIAPTILSEFGIPRPANMIGKSVFVSDPASH